MHLHIGIRETRATSFRQAPLLQIEPVRGDIGVPRQHQHHLAFGTTLAAAWTGLTPESIGGEEAAAFQLRLISADLSQRCPSARRPSCLRPRGRPEAAREAVTTISARQLCGRCVGASQCAQFSPLRSFFLYVLARTHPYCPATPLGSPSARGRFQSHTNWTWYGNLLELGEFRKGGLCRKAHSRRS
jgi:hypothetical protein